MPTVRRVGGLRFVVYSNDHSPAHVHVLGQGDGEIIAQRCDDFQAHSSFCSSDEWQLQHRYMQTEVMAELTPPLIEAAPPRISP